MGTKKLELKHLAAYLPYNVRIEYKGMKYHLDFLEIGNIKYYTLFDDYKLVLHPLPDLTKEIEVNGEKFVPIEKLASIFIGKVVPNSILNGDNGFAVYAKWRKITVCLEIYNTIEITCYNSIKSNKGYFAVNQYEIYEKLKEWHFDIFGLIKENLAIDINTLNK